MLVKKRKIKWIENVSMFSSISKTNVRLEKRKSVKKNINNINKK